LDDDGRERRDLEPGLAYEPGGWWTCHRDTAEGDLVLLYRRKPRSDDELYPVVQGRRFQDIAYLIVAKSDAYGLLDEPGAVEMGWEYGCDFEVIEKFSKPLGYHEMTADPHLAGWGALRRRFQGRAHPIPPDIWDHLLELLHIDRGEVERLQERKRQRFSREHDIESALGDDLSVLDDWRLELVARQLVCRNGGRADLVCLDKRNRRHVVIELKVGLAGRNAVAQLLSYMASVSQQLPGRREPHGILCAERLDNEARGMIDMNPALHFASLRDLGLV
jgi:hypothetical protein